MASKKTKVENPQVDETHKEQIEESAQASTETVDTAVTEAAPTDDAPQAPGETEKKQEDVAPKETKKEKAKAVEGKDIPDSVKKILAAFSNEEMLYIDKVGGVYSQDAKPSDRGAAILYRNPYFK